MSQISDVGVNFKMTGANQFESRLKALESQWKSFSGSLDKAPAMNQHFAKLSSAAESAGKRISSAMAVTKAAIAGVLAAKAGSGLFNWAIGSDDVAQKKIFAETHMNNLEMYEQYFSEIRDKHRVSRADLVQGAFEINSALSTRPEDERIEAFKTMTYYMNELGSSMTEAAQFYKKLMSSFGNTLPIEKQKTAVKDFLGMLNTVSRESSSNPTDIAKGVGTVGASYGKRGWTAEDMFAHLGYLMPTMKSPDEAANALLRITEKSPEYAGKLAAAQYRMDFMAGRVQSGVGGKQFKDYDEMVTASKESAFPNRQKAAQHALAELKIGEEHYGKEAEKEVERYIQQRKPTEIFDMLNKQVQDVQKRSANPETTLKDVFSEYSGPAVSLLRGFASGEIERLKQSLQKGSGQGVMDQVDAAKAKQLPEIWGLVQQKSEDFSASLRSVFYEPMKALLEEWKFVFQKLEKDFGGQNGVGKLRDAANHAMAGVKEGWSGKAANPAESKSLAQMFQETLDGMGVSDWKSAGMKVGKAASDFVEIMGQLKTIIGTVHGLVGKITGEHTPATIAGLWAASKTPGGPIPKAIVGSGVGVIIDMLTGNPNENILGIPGSHWAKKGIRNIIAGPEPVSTPDLMLPAHGRPQMMIPPDQMQTAHTPGGPIQGQFNGTLESNVTVNIDGEQVANAVAPKLYDKIKGTVEGLIGSGRDTATGAMLR